MRKLSEQIRVIERIDQLIRLKCTGPPKQLAGRLEVSETTLYRILDGMKQFDAPIVYSISSQSYIYESQVSFKFGFFTKELSKKEARDVNAGAGFYNNLLRYFNVSFDWKI